MTLRIQSASIISAVALCTAFVTFVLTLVLSKLSLFRSHRAMRLVSKYSPQAAQTPQSPYRALPTKFDARLALQNSAGRIGFRMQRWFKSRAATNRYQEWLNFKLAAAGRLGSQAQVTLWGNKAILALTGLCLGFSMFYRGIANGTLAITLGALIGFAIPDVALLVKTKERASGIEKQLPDVIDLLRLCLLAGLSFESSAARISVAMDGPLAEEFAALSLSVRLGKSRLQALAELLERTESQQFGQVIGALIQVERAGVSLNKTLAELARESREIRISKMREKGQKVGVKILMPLLFCLLPAMMIIVLGPALADLVTVFASI